MPRFTVPEWSKTSRVVIGMVHLPPLPGSPRYGGDLAAVRAAATADARALAEGGVHGVMIENFGDVPFYPGSAPASTVAHLTAIAAEIRRAIPEIPLGINVLRNDGCAAVAIAQAVGARFIRVNVLCGARVTDQGVIQGIAHDLLRLRRNLGAEDVAIFADVNVKHSAPLGPVHLEDETADVVKRGLADAVIVTGSGTGHATPVEELSAVKAVSGKPVLVGSGVTSETIGEYAAAGADGFIVGTSLKGAGGGVEAARVRELMRRVRG